MIKYTITPQTYCGWIVEKEDGTEYYVKASISDKDGCTFKCSCIYNTKYKKVCSHIKFVKDYLISGRRRFEK